MVWRILILIIAAHCMFHVVTSQPLAGGGGGIGGSGGGGGEFDDNNLFDDDSPACPPHCHSCSVDDVCDICYAGYKLMHDGSCAPCPLGCKKCDVHGPYKCDFCMDRYVLVSPLLHRRCEPCPKHCNRCYTDGPGACDEGQCDYGYMRNKKSKLCEACTKNCGICSDTTNSGCSKCKTFYKLDEGSCSLDIVFVTGLFVAIGIVIFTIMHERRRAVVTIHERRTAAADSSHLMPILSTHESFIAQESETALSNMISTRRLLPSGVWRGYYTHLNARHDVCEFSLEFRPDGSVSGRGVDDVGEYIINGLCDNNGSKLAFTKAYVERSRNVSGVVSYGNQGHSVEYRGELVTGTSGALGGGFRGEWSIRDDDLGNYTGSFHLWPAMEGWQDPGAEVDAEPQHTFEVESECVICFERPITTLLRPCGHQVLCRECADLLRSPPKCPICRAHIATVANRMGN